MAMFNFFDSFFEHLVKGVHNLTADTLKIMFVNTPAPAATHSVKADLSEISAGGGYNSGGITVSITSSAVSGGIFRLIGNDITFTATGSVPIFRYIILYNDTPTSPQDPLIGWWDSGYSIILTSGKSLVIDFDQTNGIFALGRI